MSQEYVWAKWYGPSGMGQVVWACTGNSCVKMNVRSFLFSRAYMLAISLSGTGKTKSRSYRSGSWQNFLYLLPPYIFSFGYRLGGQEEEKKKKRIWVILLCLPPVIYTSSPTTRPMYPHTLPVIHTLAWLLTNNSCTLLPVHGIWQVSINVKV